MADINNFTFSGRLTANPELKQTQSGKSICKVGVANDVGWGDNKNTSFFNVTFWNKDAEFIANYVHKGDPVVINGEISLRQYTDRDGNKKSSTEVTARSFKSFGSKNNGANTSVGSVQPRGDAETHNEGYLSQSDIKPATGSVNASQSEAPKFEVLNDDEELPF